MPSDRLIERIRAANPAPPAAVSDEGLFRLIVASAGDPRLAPKKSGRRGWLKIRKNDAISDPATERQAD